MNTLDQKYINLLNDIITNGTEKKDRTGVGTYSVTGRMIQHDMSEGFPVLTTKKIFFKTMSIELEGFLRGITDKQWYKDRKCNIWNQWCNPKSIPPSLTDEERKQFQLESNDLGPIYGFQWRNFNGTYNNEANYLLDGKDQLQDALDLLRKSPESRRIIVSAWNPLQQEKMALPPCHILWQVVIRGEYLDLLWFQRSADFFLGVPFNIASYGLLLSLLAKQFGYKPGILTGFFGDAHVYTNHIDQVKEQMSRASDAYLLPELIIAPEFNDVKIFDHASVSIPAYKYHPAIKAPIAV